MSSRGSRSSQYLVVTLFILLSLSAPAAADAFDDARKVFNEGQDLYDAGKYAEAADRYAAAYRLMRSPLLFFNIAQARRLQFQRDGDYRSLVTAREHYERFLAEAEPEPRDRARAQANLDEVEKVAFEEARKRFEAAENAMKLAKFEAAIADYGAAYDLSRRPGILFNLAQAERKQYQIDGQLERLARAENQLLSYRREGKGQVDPAVIDQILQEIRAQREEYHRKREAEARTKEPPAMREAREHYQRGDAQAALAALDAAERTEGNERVVMLQIYRLRGQAAALAGQPDKAVAAFKRYLALEPAADGTGLREEAAPAFAKAKEFWKGKTPLKIEHLPPGKVPPGRKVTIPIRVASDPLEMIALRELHFRRQGASEWDSLPMTGDNDQAKLPSMPPAIAGKDYRMEYYIVALDGHKSVLDALGTANAPLAFLVTEDAIIRPPPVYKRWWFWAAAGAVAAGTVATVAIIQADGLPNDNITGDLSKGLQ
jgi:tetratricopeptide (TPR) repeat protein